MCYETLVIYMWINSSFNKDRCSHYRGNCIRGDRHNLRFKPLAYQENKQELLGMSPWCSYPAENIMKIYENLN